MILRHRFNGTVRIIRTTERTSSNGISGNKPLGSKDMIVHPSRIMQANVGRYNVMILNELVYLTYQCNDATVKVIPSYRSYLFLLDYQKSGSVA